MRAQRPHLRLDPAPARACDGNDQSEKSVRPATQNDSFLVFPGGECIPIDGPLRVALLRDGWYVIGRNSTVPCGSERAARDALAHLLQAESPHVRASQALQDIESWTSSLERQR